MDNAFFKPCNHAGGRQASWLKYHEERTDFNTLKYCHNF